MYGGVGSLLTRKKAPPKRGPSWRTLITPISTDYDIAVAVHIPMIPATVPAVVMRATDAIASFSWDLDEVKQLHADLSAAMKAEANHIANLSQEPSLAA